MTRRAIVVAVCITSLAAPCAQAMDPGEWQMTQTTTSPALPGPQTATQKQCIRPGQAEDPSRLMSDMPQGCKVTVRQKTAGGYAWDMACPSEGMRGTGSVTFTATTMQGEVKATVEQGGQKFEMLTKMSGRRLGAC
jgi:hypothetical protein